MNYILFIVIIALFACVYVVLGFLASRKITNTTDYFLAGRNLGIVPVTFTLIATQLGGGMLLGTAQEAYTNGIWGICYTIGMSIGFLLLASGVARRLQSLNVVTTAELFETKYGSKTLKRVASLLSIITLCGLFVGQIVASRTIIESLSFANSEFVFIIFWLFVIISASLGGLYAVAETDMYQVLYIITVFSGIAAYAIYQSPGSITSLVTAWNSQNTIPFNMIGVIVMPALFSLIEQDLAQRFFASKTGKTATYAALLASIFLLSFALIPIYFGIQAREMGIDVPQGASPLLPFISYIAGETVVILALCGLIGAISSTADSLLCAISSNVAQDFNLTGSSPQATLRISRLITFIIGVGAVATSFVVPQNIIGILIGSYEISVSCMLIPLLISYYSDKLNRYAAWGSFIGGLGAIAVFSVFPIGIPRELVSIAVSAVGYIIGSKIRP